MAWTADTTVLGGGTITDALVNAGAGATIYLEVQDSSNVPSAIASYLVPTPPTAPTVSITGYDATTSAPTITVTALTTADAAATVTGHKILVVASGGAAPVQSDFNGLTWTSDTTPLGGGTITDTTTITTPLGTGDSIYIQVHDSNGVVSIISAPYTV
jgi:hypothetical protein